MGGGKYWFGKTAYKVLKELVIPVKIKGRDLGVRRKTLEGEIPMLIGRKTIEDWNMKLDFENKIKIRWGNEMIHYKVDGRRHIKMKLFNKEERGWMGGDWRGNREQWEKIARKFH